MDRYLTTLVLFDCSCELDVNAKIEYEISAEIDEASFSAVSVAAGLAHIIVFLVVIVAVVVIVVVVVIVNIVAVVVFVIVVVVGMLIEV